VPKEVKERVKDFIPPELVDKVATEEDAKNVDELKAFLKAKNHPVVARWTAEEAPAAAPEAQALQVTEEAVGTMMPVATAGTLPIMAGGFRIILKDAKIYANKVIIQTVKDDKDKR
jgi:acetyl-CoA decarbonylase/synthase complex subunit beta